MPTGIYERKKRKLPYAAKDIAGKRFGKLVAIKRTRKYRVASSPNCATYYWLFKCDCGNEKEILMSNVTRTNKSTVSCGCLRRRAKAHLGSAEKVAFMQRGMRQLWLKWPPRYHVRKAANVRRGVYLCAGYTIDPHEVGNKDIHVDHIEPVGSYYDWNEFVDRLFCPAENLQVLCKECHKGKTADERKNN